MRNERSPDFSYTISVSMLEIYNERVRDLLKAPQNPPSMNVNDGSGCKVCGSMRLDSFKFTYVNTININFSHRTSHVLHEKIKGPKRSNRHVC